MTKLLSILALCVIATGAWGGLPHAPLLDGVTYSTVALFADGSQMRLGLSADDKYRIQARLDDIAPEAVATLLQYEDKYYFYHPGVNLFSLVRGGLSLFHGRKVGGSTITMQVARLRYKLHTASIGGKIKQIIYAIGIELRHDKQEILEAYFNLAPYGSNIEGIEAASRIYFHKSAKQLTPQETAALAIIPQNPNARKPENAGAFEKARFLTYAPGAANGQFTGLGRLSFHSLRDLPFRAPHVAVDIIRERSGKIHYATLQRDLQSMLEKVLGNYTERGSIEGINNAAAMLVDMNDMSVQALAGSADFFSAKIQGQIDGTKARRSPGSTLKPFIYGLGLDQGLIHPASILADSPRSFGGYDPENFDLGFKGPVSAADALRISRNLPAITLAERLHAGGLYDFLKAAQVKLPKPADYYGLALVLGGAEITMRELAGLYAILGNNGLWRPLRLLANSPSSAPVRLLSPEAAWLTANMLRSPDLEVRSFGQLLPVFYKTGTSNGFRDAWTAGIIGQYVLVVWTGNFDNSSNPAFIGATAALPLFREIAAILGTMRRLQNKISPTPRKLNLTPVKICAATGDIFRGQCDEIAETWFIPGVSPIEDTGIYRKIMVDKKTGLRACKENPVKNYSVWMEFWPSDMLKIFEQAGISKPAPPDWLEECATTAPSPGSLPRIILPKKNVVYQRRIDEYGFRLPLMASADKEAGKIHWFADGVYLGSALPGETIFWQAAAGNYRLLAIDDRGRETGQKCRVENQAGF